MAAADGTNLVLAGLEPPTLTWRVIGFVAVSHGVVEVSVPGAGGFSLVEPDAGVAAPPPAVIGEALGSAATPSGDLVSSATLSFDPPTVLPAQTSAATVDYVETANREAPASGLAVTLTVTEELTLLDGTSQTTAPFRADLIVYHQSAGLRSTFRLRPSSVPSAADRLGADDVRSCHMAGSPCAQRPRP